MRWLAWIAAVACVAALPLLGDNYLLRLATTMLMYIVLAVSWNVIGGFAGYPSFGTAAFFGLGAYAGAIVQQAGVPMVAAWIWAGVVAAVFAIALGAAILHLKGHYFAIASLVVGEVLREIANSATGLTGGGMGLNLPILRIGVDDAARLFFYAMLGLAAIAFGASVLLSRHRVGFALRCIQQNEDAAGIIGIDTTAMKNAAFCLSAVFVGSAGAIYASWVNYIEPLDVFDVLISIKPIVMVLMGGVGTLLGPVIGAVAFLALEELVWRNFLSVHAAILGVIIVALVLFLPGGLATLRGRRFPFWRTAR